MGTHGHRVPNLFFAVGTLFPYFRGLAGSVVVQLYNQCRIVAENSVKCVAPQDGFFGIQILQNPISARAPPGPR